jgi:hypothetical protein
MTSSFSYQEEIRSSNVIILSIDIGNETEIMSDVMTQNDCLTKDLNCGKSQFDIQKLR